MHSERNRLQAVYFKTTSTIALVYKNNPNIISKQNAQAKTIYFMYIYKQIKREKVEWRGLRFNTYVNAKLNSHHSICTYILRLRVNAIHKSSKFKLPPHTHTHFVKYAQNMPFWMGPFPETIYTYKYFIFFFIFSFTNPD